MIANMPSISRVTRRVKNTAFLARVPRPSACQRCGGTLVDEQCMDIGEEGSGNRFWGMRCIQCGDVIDETILRNRFSSIENLQKLRSHTKSQRLAA
jgi:hypothetical protein